MDLSGPAPFADEGAEVIARTVNVTLETHAESQQALEVFYELDRSVEKIRQVGASRVALQFPDEWLPDASRVARELEARLKGVQIVILADTSYGTCCVDEVAASHADAQLIIHYGRSCLSPTQRLPVLYVFGRKEVDADRAALALLETSQGLDQEMKSSCSNWLLTGDVQYAWALDQVAASLRSRLPEGAKVYQAHIPKEQLMVSKPHDYDEELKEEDRGREGKEGCSSSSCCTKDESIQGRGGGCCSSSQIPSGSGAIPPVEDPTGSTPAKRLWDFPEHGKEEEGEKAVMLFIGTEGPTLSNLMLTHGQYPALSYDPSTDQARQETLAVNRALMRR